MAERVADRPAERGAERGPVPGTSARPDTAAARAARRARREQGRWVREVKGILALALAGFSGVALFAYEPTLHLLDQSSPVGPVGVWLGWIFFWAFGYAGFLFPLLLAGYGASAFIRSRMVTGWPAGLRARLLPHRRTGILAGKAEQLVEAAHPQGRGPRRARNQGPPGLGGHRGRLDHLARAHPGGRAPHHAHLAPRHVGRAG